MEKGEIWFELKVEYQNIFKWKIGEKKMQKIYKS
jgi:hypothetical protein